MMEKAAKALSTAPNNKFLYILPAFPAWFLIVHIALTFAMAAATPTRVYQHFQRTPSNQTATVGDRVTLACSVVNLAGVVQWTRNEFGLGTDRSLEGYDRYSMNISKDEGDFTLEIFPVTLDDDAMFQCQVGPGTDGNKALRSANAKLTVEVPTSQPEIIQGGLLEVKESKKAQLECISRGGKPAAEIRWIDGNGHEVKSGLVTTKQLLGHDKRYNTISIFRFVPSGEDHDKMFTCQAHNRPAKKWMSAKIRLNVKFAPRVTVKVQTPLIREFDNVHVLCDAKGNPPEMSYIWFLNDTLLPENHGPLLILSNVTRKLHNAKVKCEVVNSLGRSDESDTLSIFYGPLFHNRPQDVQADLGTLVTLSCDAIGNPPPMIVWIFETTGAVVHNKPNYTMTLTEDSKGKYICQVHVLGFPAISAEAIVHLRGAPIIVSERIQFGVRGRTVRLECFAKSTPPPENITWTHLGRTLDGHHSDYFVQENVMPNGKQSLLVLRSSQEKDFGPYNCSVTNSYGSNIVEIQLMKQEGIQLKVVPTCIALVGLATIVLGMIACKCRKNKPVCGEIKDAETKTNQSSLNDSPFYSEVMHAGYDSEGSDGLRNHSNCRYSDHIKQGDDFTPCPELALSTFRTLSHTQVANDFN